MADAGGRVSDRTWFPEASRADATWAADGESLAEWLARSTLPLARDVRRFYNENLNKLPAAAAQSIFGMIARGLDRRGFFELLVGRFLQELGASLEYERPTAAGKRLDYLATFPDGAVFVEATSPVLNAAAAAQERQQAPLARIVKDAAPSEGWIVSLHALPALGPNDSKQPLRDAVRDLYRQLPDPPPDEPSRHFELVTRVVDDYRADLRLSAWPRPGRPTQFLGPAVGYMDDVPYRIRAVVAEKRAQARGAEDAVVLAIDGWWMGTDLERFDTGLFGHGPGMTDGVLAKRRLEAPTIAGVLAFVAVGERGGSDPVLYEHPRLAEPLPAAFDIIGRRRLIGDAIATFAGTRSGVLHALRFASD